MNTYSKIFFKFIAPILVLLAIAEGLSAYLDTDTPLSIAVIAAALIAFAFFISPQQSDEPKDEGRLRRAIAGAIVVEYLVLVGIVAFFGRGPEQLPPITQSLISSFTTIVGVVIAFYFGSSAYVEGQKRKSA